MLGDGKNQSERSNRVVNFLFYESVMVGMTLFFFNWFCAFTASSMHDSVMLLVANYFFLFPNVLVVAICDKPTCISVNMMFPALYMDGIIRKRHKFLFFLV